MALLRHIFVFCLWAASLDPSLQSSHEISEQLATPRAIDYFSSSPSKLERRGHEYGLRRTKNAQIQDLKHFLDDFNNLSKCWASYRNFPETQRKRRCENAARKCLDKVEGVKHLLSQPQKYAVYKYSGIFENSPRARRNTRQKYPKQDLMRALTVFEIHLSKKFANPEDRRLYCSLYKHKFDTLFEKADPEVKLPKRYMQLASKYYEGIDRSKWEIPNNLRSVRTTPLEQMDETHGMPETAPFGQNRGELKELKSQSITLNQQRANLQESNSQKSDSMHGGIQRSEHGSTPGGSPRQSSTDSGLPDPQDAREWFEGTLAL